MSCKKYAPHTEENAHPNDMNVQEYVHRFNQNPYFFDHPQLDFSEPGIHRPKFVTFASSDGADITGCLTTQSHKALTKASPVAEMTAGDSVSPAGTHHYHLSMAENKQRLLSIDIVRGFTILLMLFVNDLYMPAVPSWMGHTAASTDGMGLADWVFPSFLFMVGMSVPYAISSRLRQGECMLDIILHIAWRSFSLILIGVALLNGGRLNTELAGISRQCWTLLFYLGIFILWNDYPKDNDHQTTFSLIRLTGIALIAYLLIIFVSNDPEHPWLVHSWWGILGLIGWSYLAAALICLFTEGKTVWAAVSCAVFLALNILFCANRSGDSILHIKGGVMDFFGILIGGNNPMTVLFGMTVGAFLKNSKLTGKDKVVRLLAAGCLSLAAGFVLRRWFIISKIMATPSWALICIGISILFTAIVFFITDVKKKSKGTLLLAKAGRNPMTVYILPGVFYTIIWATGAKVLVYKVAESAASAILGSIAWALAMVLICIGLEKLHIKLKL